MSELTLSKGAMSDLLNHYTGNCFDCDRCSFYEAIQRNEPGAVEAYVKYMREERGVKVKTKTKK